VNNQLQKWDKPFDSAGPANAPSIVLVYGSVLTRKMWIPQLRGLSDSMYALFDERFSIMKLMV
jgi:hypothetical protein